MKLNHINYCIYMAVVLLHALHDVTVDYYNF